MQQKNANGRQKEYEKRLKTKNEYDTLCAQLQAVEDLNVPPHKWNQAQLRTMVKWLDGPPPLNDTGDINVNAVNSSTKNDGVMDPSHESNEEEVAAILLSASCSRHL